MPTLTQPTVRKLPPPRDTPCICRVVDRLAAAEGLPPEPRPAA